MIRGGAWRTNCNGAIFKIRPDRNQSGSGRPRKVRSRRRGSDRKNHAVVDGSWVSLDATTVAWAFLYACPFLAATRFRRLHANRLGRALTPLISDIHLICRTQEVSGPPGCAQSHPGTLGGFLIHRVRDLYLICMDRTSCPPGLLDSPPTASAGVFIRRASGISIWRRTSSSEMSAAPPCLGVFAPAPDDPRVPACFLLQSPPPDSYNHGARHCHFGCSRHTMCPAGISLRRWLTVRLC